MSSVSLAADSTTKLRSKGSGTRLGHPMAAKIVVAALLGALFGMLTVTGGMLWPPRTPDQRSAATIARIESAWNVARRNHAP